ncbi:DUF1905 domain-containing protein, partial [Nostoc sp. 3335mG]
MARFGFSAEVIHWRGPAPYYFARLPAEVAAQVGEMARSVSYGWGVIPVECTIGDMVFRTSLFPKDGGYLLPLKDAVRKNIAIPADNLVTVEMTV